MKAIKTLTEYGLTERQASVYVACLELGVASIQQISRKIHIPRSSCEATLSQLKDKGFVTSYQHKTVRKFSSVDPRKVVKAAEQKVNNLTLALPDLVGFYLKNKTIPSVRMYDGKHGMGLVLEEILTEARELYGFGSADELLQVWGQIYPDFRKRRIQNKIPIKIILKDSPFARQRQEAGPKELREVRLIKGVGDFSSLIFMWNNKIASFSLKSELMAVVVESKELTAGQMAMFTFMWNSLPGYEPKH